ncbi:MAG: SDR family oxidoreductase, partial [Acidimicrobiales bacterium]|jgi:NAD(P)-dependent dehydrogenase (short-subunit alcohol dehydrogenase family)
MNIAITTGAGTGIGRSAAQHLAQDGWTVVAAGRRLEPLQETIASLEGDGHLAFPADVADPSDVDALFAATVKAFGRVDLLFNNAGVGAPPVPFDEISVEDWKRVVDINLTGSFLCARAAFGQMRKQKPRGGRIINNGSISAQTPRPHSAPYTSTKHAITGLTKSISLDGRSLDIACGQIDIGNAATAMVEIMKRGVPQADGSIKPEATMHVDETGRAVAYMASLPLDANVLTMTVMANKMPLVGRG